MRLELCVYLLLGGSLVCTAEQVDTASNLAGTGDTDSPAVRWKRYIKFNGRLFTKAIRYLEEYPGARKLPKTAKKAKLIGQGALNVLLTRSIKKSVKRKNKKRTNVQIYKRGNLDVAIDTFEFINPVERKVFVDDKDPQNFVETGRIGNMQITIRTSSKSYPKWPTIEIYDTLKTSGQQYYYKFRYVGKIYPASQ